MLTTALRFVPNFLADSEITLDAQSCRGYSNRGNCVKRLLSYVVVISRWSCGRWPSPKRWR